MSQMRKRDERHGKEEEETNERYECDEAGERGATGVRKERVRSQMRD